MKDLITSTYAISKMYADFKDVSDTWRIYIYISLTYALAN